MGRINVTIRIFAGTLVPNFRNQPAAQGAGAALPLAHPQSLRGRLAFEGEAQQTLCPKRPGAITRAQCRIFS